MIAARWSQYRYSTVTVIITDRYEIVKDELRIREREVGSATVGRMVPFSIHPYRSLIRCNDCMEGILCILITER